MRFLPRPLRAYRLIGFSLFALALNLSAFGEPVEEGRYAEEIRAFVERAEVEPVEDGAVLCIGSSSMRMWADRMEDDLAPLPVVPLGFGGSHYSDVIYHFDALIGSYDPRAILLYEGDNDINSGMSAEEATRDAEALLALIHEKDAAIRVYFVGIKPSPARAAVWEESVRANEMLAALCETDERLVYIDVASGMLTESGAMMPEIYLEDELHLNAAGYDLWSRAIREVLVPAEAER